MRWSLVKREREVMILPEDRFGRELTASSKENVVTPLICCVSTQSLTLVDILLCVSRQFVLCCALFLVHSISDYAIVSQSWIARKISPCCDELVAVGWRTFAAKGEVGEPVRVARSRRRRIAQSMRRVV